MARPRKAPAFLVTTTVNKSQRLADLPSDSARLGYFYAVLPQAKLAPIQGQFASRAIFSEVAGRFARFEKAYIAVGVLEVAPGLCERCKGRWKVVPKRGALVVHDWHDHQYDPARLEQQRIWDAEHRGVSDGVSDTVSDRVSDGQSDRVSDRNSDTISDGYLARGGDAAASGAGRLNVERRTTNESLPEEDRSSHVVARPDVAALLARGWPRVTKAQLAMLDEIADRHDRPSIGEALGTWAAGVIVGTPEDWDPLGNLKFVDKGWQQEQRARIDADEAAYTKEKADRAAEPSTPLEELLR